MKAKTLCAIAAVLLALPAMQAADKPAPKVQTKPASSHGVLGQAETLTGSIMMVAPESTVVVLKDSQGTTYDIVVTKATRLRSGDRPIHLKDLSTDTNKTATVKFVPERSGDIAQSIRIAG
ncbi:MAG TPA: hypothetical protein VH639_10020 [Bryobacteraceae bacterium]